MAKEGLAGYVVPSTDAHQVGARFKTFIFFQPQNVHRSRFMSFPLTQSEYVAPEDKRRAWLSGYTGSNG